MTLTGQLWIGGILQVCPVECIISAGGTGISQGAEPFTPSTLNPEHKKQA